MGLNFLLFHLSAHLCKTRHSLVPITESLFSEKWPRYSVKRNLKLILRFFFRPLLFTDSFSVNFNLDANLIFAFWGSVNWNLCDLKHNIRAHVVFISYYRVDHININSIYQGLGKVLQEHFTWHFKKSLDGGRTWFLLLKLPLQNRKRKREEKGAKAKQKKKSKWME